MLPTDPKVKIFSTFILKSKLNAVVLKTKIMKTLFFLFLFRFGFRTGEQNGENEKSCVHLAPCHRVTACFTLGCTRTHFPPVTHTQWPSLQCQGLTVPGIFARHFTRLHHIRCRAIAPQFRVLYDPPVPTPENALVPVACYLQQ